MKPEVEIIGISVKTFGVTFALGFLACGLVIAKRLRELEKPVDWAYEIVFAALLGGVIGARVYYLIQNY
ncbi:MAG TPA: prolipoprotein diacylglyceryl transferase family protein, partial [Solirubrobacteraceae bacterium]|nr:prolipoprotein diacylglyceryl transferase family protein [Solirubrobacteraceae bacterium]